MSNSSTPARKKLDAWREQQADRLDPLRFHFLEALERRTAAHDGEVRRMLDEKLSMHMDAYAIELKKTEAATAPASAPARETLGSLMDHIANHAAGHGVARPSSFPELPALDAFRKTWSRIHGESQLRQALDHLPANAGPLNSSALVHRSIVLMRDISPGYLKQFLSYVEALSWMEQMNDGGMSVVKDSATKRARGSKRKSDVPPT